MSSRPRLGGAWLALLALALHAASGCNRVQVRPRGPSVLLVTIDTLRADHVGAYGAPWAETPTLDALAARGVRVESAFATAPLTLPSHASILTGLAPPRHGVRHNGVHRLPDRVTTLAEVFHAAGYRTGAVVGAAVLAGHFGLDQGFDFYDDRDFEDTASSTGYAERRAGRVTDAALAWLRQGRGPFFLWVHYYDPHGAYRAPAAFAARFPGRPYDAEVAYVDAELGRLLGGLGAARDSTCVAVTADHGESLGEHGEPTHAYGLYDAVLRVPLLLAGPGVPFGQRVAGVRSTLDLAPTLVSLAGLVSLPAAEGRDLSRGWSPARPGSGSPAGLRAESARRPAYAETLATQIDHGWAPLYALRSDTHLYVRAPRPELYDVRRDPGERVNLLEREDAGARRVAATLDAQLDADLEGAVVSQPASIDSAMRDKLRSLGYVAGDAPEASSGLDPKDGLPLLGRFIAAEALYQRDRYPEAARAARALLQEMPRSARTLDLLARIELARSRPAEALAPALRAVSLVPESARHREMLGSVRLATGDVRGAVADFEAALALDPGHAEARAGRMWRLALGAPLEEAVADAEAALAARPRDRALRAQVADAWDRLGQYDRALSTWQQLLSQDPGDRAAHLGAALQLVRFGRDSQAEAHLDRAGEAAHAPRFQLRLAVALAARGKRERAAGLLRDLLRRYPDWPTPSRVLARVEAGD